MKARAKSLKMVFQYNVLSGQQIQNSIDYVFEKGNFIKTFYIHEKKVSISTITKKVKQKGYWPTGVSSDEFEFGYGGIGNRDQSFFEIKEKIPGLASDWSLWVMPFLELEGFVQAWVSDVEYNYWQNACDPIEFTSVGREYLHLPMKSNGLPYPLAQQIVDTSKNPGRWVFHMGFIEAIGSTMWLGEHFWHYVGRDKKQKLLNESWIRTEVLENGVVKLVAADDCFMDESTSDKQNRLREILYGDLAIWRSRGQALAIKGSRSTRSRGQTP